MPLLAVLVAHTTSSAAAVVHVLQGSGEIMISTMGAPDGKVGGCGGLESCAVCCFNSRVSDPSLLGAVVLCCVMLCFCRC